MYIDECNAIQKKLTKNQITVIPVKGTVLVPKMYQLYDIRNMGDLDFLERKADGNRLATCLADMGYVQGDFDRNTQKIEYIS